MSHTARHLIRLLPVLVIGLCGGCERHGGTSDNGPVVLYTSVDEPYARPLIERFEKKTGIRVRLVTDAEASKSVGLAERLRAERAHPQADVWWGNECFLTINLAEEGVLAPYDSPAASDIPATFKDPQHRWASNVMRVRVMVWSRQSRVGKLERLSDLLRPELKGHLALARPTAGTTGGHVAALYVLWGKDRAENFFRGLHDNGVRLVGGNSVVAESVARGDLWAGMCDNDDAADASGNIGQLDSALPDQGEGEDGTLAVPCTVALVAGAPHSEAAKRLMDYLLSPEADESLVGAKFAWCSTRAASGHGKFMIVDYAAVAKTMPAAIRSATSILEGR